MLQNPHVLLTLDKVHNPLRLPRETTSQPPKVVRTPGVLYILTSKCASRHNGVHFFDIATSKSGPSMVCFVHFDLDMCFAPQRCATFSTSQLPKVVRRWCVLYILTSKCASRHNGVHFFYISTSKSGPTMVCFVHFDFEMCFAPHSVQIFISHLASWLRTRRFSEPTFRPSGASNHWKNTVFRDFRTFSRVCIFFLLALSLLLFSLLIFSLLSASALLCFSSVHIVGSLTSKFPSPTTLHCITVHYTTLMTLHYATTTTATTIVTTTKLHYMTLHHATTTTTLPYTTLDCTTLYHTTVHNATVRYNTVHYDALH